MSAVPPMPGANPSEHLHLDLQDIEMMQTVADYPGFDIGDSRRVRELHEMGYIEPAGWRLTPIGAEWFVGSES